MKSTARRLAEPAMAPELRAHAQWRLLSRLAINGDQRMNLLELLCADDQKLRFRGYQTRTLCSELEADGQLTWARGVVQITDHGRAVLATLGGPQS